MSTCAPENYPEEKGLAFGHDPEGFLKGRKASPFSIGPQSLAILGLGRSIPLHLFTLDKLFT